MSPRPLPLLPLLPPRAISRVDRRGIHCWRVAIKRRGQDHLAHFHDHDHHGRAGALRAATAYFHEALRRLPPPLRTSTRDVRSQTGVVGVSFERGVRPTGSVYSCYRAVWPLGHGRYRKRSFSIGKLGRRKAFNLARQAREQGLAELARSLRESLDHELDRRTARGHTARSRRRSPK